MILILQAATNNPELQKAFYLVIGAIVACVIGFAAFVTSLGVIYAKIVKPIVEGVKSKILTPLDTLAEKINGIGDSVKTLTEDVSHLKEATKHYEAVSLGEQLKSLKQEIAYNSFKHRLASKRAITPIFIMDDKGHVTFTNKALCSLFGVDAESLSGLNWLQIVDPEERADVQELWQAAYRNLSNYDNRQSMLVKGNLKTVRVTAEPFIYQGKVLNYYGVLSIEGETMDLGIHTGMHDALQHVTA